MSSRAEILHADVDAFFASVEQRDDPRLRGRPVIVGGGVVLAASYEAKAYGVRTAMGGRQARRLCPDAIVVSPRMSAYSEASTAMFEVFENATPAVEGLSIDEAFLDVRGMERLAGPAEEIAARLKRDVREQVGLPIHDRRRAHEVPRQGRERRREAGRPPGRAAGRRARLPPPAAGRAALGRRSGHCGEAPWARDQDCGPGGGARGDGARGVAGTRVGTAPARARAQPRPAARGAREAARLDRLATGAGPAAPVGGRARRDPDRDRRPGHAAAARREPHVSYRRAAAALRRLLARDAVAHAAAADEPDARRARDCALAARVLDALDREAGHHAARPLAREPRQRRSAPARAAVRPAPAPELDLAVDEIRDRYGSTAVTRAVLVGRDPGISMPLLPD